MNQQHLGEIAASAGAPLENAKAAVMMVHGRGDSAPGILGLANEFALPGITFVAPQATQHTWYPNSFLAPMEMNEPWLSSALEALGSVSEQIAKHVPLEKTVLLGFSQGACLVSEYGARNPRRYGGIVALSGGLIGPEGTPRDYQGSLEDTPAFFGCSDIDQHIPEARVHESAEVLERLGASVTKRIYPGMGHTVNRDEVDFIQNLLAELIA